MARLVLRSGAEGDLGAIDAIYAYYVRETPITFDLELFSAQQRRGWFEGFSEHGRHRLLVAERDGSVAGYACSHRFRPKAAYDTSVETTIYLDPQATGEGIGTRLYGRLLEELAGEDAHRALAGITLPNPASIALHEHFGFTPVGVYHEVGYKFGRYWDVQWFERALR